MNIQKKKFFFITIENVCKYKVTKIFNSYKNLQNLTLYIEIQTTR